MLLLNLLEISHHLLYLLAIYIQSYHSYQLLDFAPLYMYKSADVYIGAARPVVYKVEPLYTGQVAGLMTQRCPLFRGC